MARAKITDRLEVTRWIREGKTYQEMADIYAERGIQIEPGAFASFRYRNRIPARKMRHRDLMPWTLKAVHKHDTIAIYLRAEGRRQAGLEVGAERLLMVRDFFRNLDREGLVVHYDPDTKNGFWLIPREDFDEGYVRHPDDLPLEDDLEEYRPK